MDPDGIFKKFREALQHFVLSDDNAVNRLNRCLDSIRPCLRDPARDLYGKRELVDEYETICKAATELSEKQSDSEEEARKIASRLIALYGEVATFQWGQTPPK